MRIVLSSPAVASLLMIAACSRGSSPPATSPPGAPQSAESQALETGAGVVQTTAPVNRLDMVLAGFHPMAHEPSRVVEAYHYCTKVNEDFTQCVLFDGTTANANMNGVEYIISERIYETLPNEERQYWHPHNYEILSGALVMPNVPAQVEHRAMRQMLNTYGKTWHVWDSGRVGQPGQALPAGPAHLAWSYNADGELPPEILNDRDRRLKVDSTKKRMERQDLVELAHPQHGTDRLAEHFQGRKKPPGVVEAP